MFALSRDFMPNCLGWLHRFTIMYSILTLNAVQSPLTPIVDSEKWLVLNKNNVDNLLTEYLYTDEFRLFLARASMWEVECVQKDRWMSGRQNMPQYNGCVFKLCHSLAFAWGSKITLFTFKEFHTTALEKKTFLKHQV